MDLTMTALDTYSGLRAFADELARCGMRHACTSPGSRSTPLVLSLVREPRIEAFSHIDERCAGFFALGLAKATQVPVGLTCTSGTAAANFAPAVIEAYEARVPLVVMTADRPPELRDVGAGQTIDQIKLFGSAAKWFVEVDDHAATPERLAWMRQLAARAFWTARDGRQGPVHLNFQLREPLVLEEELPADDSGRPGGRPWIQRRRSPAAAAPDTVKAIAGRLTKAERPLIVAGRQERDGELGAVLAGLAERFAIPLLAEPTSGARRGGAAIAHYDALLRDEEWAQSVRPDLVLRVGDLPTSKPLRQWLATIPGSAQISFDPENAWQDPAGAVGIVLAADPRLTLQAAAEAATAERSTDWLDAFKDDDARAAAAIDATLGEELSEPRIARYLGASLPAQATLVVASSMPIRDVETFFGVRDDPPRVLANRGANGIDGTVSTAFGAAAARTGPVTLLIGDVALLHDIGGLLAATRLGLDVSIVVINNDGGGIFEFLPVATQTDAFEEHVATPHGVDLELAGALYGLPHRIAETLEDLAAPGIVEVRTDRQDNVARHRSVWQAVARSVRGAA
jgi:2-succinyl-5-enolpyruvyl-6-hydroxy-3-cyclohexene-1-carboxylate synthase